MGHSQPVQNLSGVKTWVNDTRGQGDSKGTPAPDKSRADYADGKPQRDRVLPLPSGHPEGRTETRSGPPVFNTPSDSSGSSSSYSKQNNPNAIPNQPNGKPLHERSRSLPQGGEEYGHPYLDQSQSTGLKRRVASEGEEGYWDLDGSGQLVKYALLRVLPPKRRQRKQKGEAKRKYKVRRRTKLRKNRVSRMRQLKRYYRRNKRRILRYQKNYRRNPTRYKRLDGGGVSTIKQQNQRSRSRKAYLSEVLDMRYYDIDEEGQLIDEVLGEESLSAEELAAYKKMKSTQKIQMGLSRKQDKNKNQTSKKKRRDKYRQNKSKMRRKQKEWRRKTKHVRKYAGGDLKLTTLQLLLAILRSAHWSHWTSHWQVKGSNSYSDHQLLQRLYESLDEEIDTLAEKIVGEYGELGVKPVEQAQLMANQVLPRVDVADPVERALLVEESLQLAFKLVYDQLKERGGLSLGLDDFIMSIANAHETNLYLLRQRKAGA